MTEYTKRHTIIKQGGKVQHLVLSTISKYVTEEQIASGRYTAWTFKTLKEAAKPADEEEGPWDRLSSIVGPRGKWYDAYGKPRG